MKKICIIYTGGTIGMVATENGYAPRKGALSKELKSIKDLSASDIPKWDLVEFDPLLDSSDMSYQEWNTIAETIEKKYKAYDGFVILHGTDTMAYSASALSFMLENVSKPVIFTGAQIPLCELRSDGKDNLITSLLIAADGIVNEVCLYFGNRLIRGNRAVKDSADGLIAFGSPNYPPLATAGIRIDYNREILLPKPTAPFKITKITKQAIGVIKIFPGIQFGIFEPIITEHLDGLILETFGAGNIPSYDNNLLPLISKAISNGTIVVVCTQCQHGTVSLGAYEASSQLEKAGAIAGNNMTTETAIAKLYYLFSLGISREEILELMEENLCGELS